MKGLFSNQRFKIHCATFRLFTTKVNSRPDFFVTQLSLRATSQVAWQSLFMLPLVTMGIQEDGFVYQESLTNSLGFGVDVCCRMKFDRNTISLISLQNWLQNFGD